jgi:uncharacterized protein (UPF0332 family)
MTVTAHDFFAFAEACLSDNPNEIRCRNAASRAYYSALHECRAVQHLCPANEQFVIDGGSHARLIDAFANCDRASAGGPQAVGMAYLMKQMKRVREWADYEIATDFPFGEAALQLKHAEKLAAKAKELAALSSGKRPG